MPSQRAIRRARAKRPQLTSVGIIGEQFPNGLLEAVRRRWPGASIIVITNVAQVCPCPTCTSLTPAQRAYVIAKVDRETVEQVDVLVIGPWIEQSDRGHAWRLMATAHRAGRPVFDFERGLHRLQPHGWALA
jgi:hypothetical protein